MDLDIRLLKDTTTLISDLGQVLCLLSISFICKNATYPTVLLQRVTETDW